MTYDPVAYWTARGATYEATFRPARYAAQEAALAELLAGLEFDSVLEVGCGFGRIGALVRSVRPSAAYTGIDLSADLLASARRRIPAGTFVETSLADFATRDRFDLVLAVEVLMHVPPAELPAAIRKLDRLAVRDLVTVDWTAPLGRRPIAPHNFLHQYAPLLSVGPFGRIREVRTTPVGRQTIHHVAKARP